MYQYDAEESAYKHGVAAGKLTASKEFKSWLFTGFLLGVIVTVVAVLIILGSSIYYN